MKAAQLQAMLLRRREIEQSKIEKSAAVNNYFDKWGKITSRYETWTTPEYYKEATEILQKQKENIEKQEKLKTRRETLRKLLSNESHEYLNELQEKTRSRSRIHSADVLEQIKTSKIETEEHKKRQELEKNLYKNWRLGVDRDQVIREARTDHEALAKLNWLDRQVAFQLQNDRDKKEQQEREIKLQEEARKREAFITKCREAREAEIKELRTFQETHLRELKNRENECHQMKLEESRLKTRLTEIEEELNKLFLNSRQRKDRIIALYNLRRIKMLLRERSEQVRRDLKQDIQILQKIGLEWADPKSIQYLTEKFKMQYDLELEKQAYIEAMYESEAKHSLTKQEKVWDDEAQLREQQIKTLLQDCADELKKSIETIAEKQKNLVSVRETHLKAIENANSRLQVLLQDKLEQIEHDIDQPILVNKKQTESFPPPPLSITSRPSAGLGRIIHPDIDLDDITTKLRKVGFESPSPQPSETSPLRIPQFGRKKIAWC